MNKGISNKILILEDEVLVAFDLKEILVSLGYEVEVSHSVVDAFELVKIFLPELLICDINLGLGKNGFDFTEDLKKLPSSPEIIYVTAFSNNTYIEKAIEMGALNYIVKPWNEQQIKVTVQMAFDLIMRKNRTSQLVGQLSLTEYKILELIAKQKTSKEIADLLFIAEKTVRNHRYNIIKKLNLSGDKNSLLKWAMANVVQ